MPSTNRESQKRLRGSARGSTGEHKGVASEHMGASREQTYETGRWRASTERHMLLSLKITKYIYMPNLGEPDKFIARNVPLRGAMSG